MDKTIKSCHSKNLFMDLDYKNDSKERKSSETKYNEKKIKINSTKKSFLKMNIDNLSYSINI